MSDNGNVLDMLVGGGLLPHVYCTNILLERQTSTVETPATANAKAAAANCQDKIAVFLDQKQKCLDIVDI